MIFWLFQLLWKICHRLVWTLNRWISFQLGSNNLFSFILISICRAVGNVSEIQWLFLEKSYVFLSGFLKTIGIFSFFILDSFTTFRGWRGDVGSCPLFPWALTYSSQLPTYCLLLFFLSFYGRSSSRTLAQRERTSSSSFILELRDVKHKNSLLKLVSFIFTTVGRMFPVLVRESPTVMKRR